LAFGTSSALTSAESSTAGSNTFWGSRARDAEASPVPQPVLRKKLRRKEMVAFFAQVGPTVIAIEACGASHHWARQLQSRFFMLPM